MRYLVEFLPRADKQLYKYPAELQDRLLAAISRLSDNPRPIGAKKMHGFRNRWRLRAGDYRVIYEIKDDVLVVLVIEIGHRREIYR